MSKKILVVRYRFIGDMILTIPFLRNLRYAYPDSQIDMLVAPNSGEVIENCPYVDNFIYFDTTRKHKYENGSGKKQSFWHYVSQLRKGKYDKAYVLKRSLSSALLCFFAGIKERVGYDTENRGIFLSKKVKYDNIRHEALCMLDVLEKDGISIKDNYLENWIDVKSEEKVQRLFEENKISEEAIKVVVSATASNPNKTWDINRFAQVIKYLSDEKKAQVIFIGAPSDKQIYENMNYGVNLAIPPVNLCGKVNLKDSLAVLKRVDFIIGNDSGTLHMAASVNTKVIGLYGPMPFEKWKILGDGSIPLKADLDCMPCYLRKKCPNNKACLNLITVEQVKQAIEKIISV
ncbi:lipopolysaccharide heptosyltransferase II [bacterium]|nr:lipopolysaccharide heptosyltransferase II [bacterium]